jgi:tetratricopeptide (TPR) repeat protein
MRATFRQCDIWVSPLALWGHSVRVQPDSSIAHVNYGDALSQATLYDGAIDEYRIGLSIDPTDVVAVRHLAHAFVSLQQLQLAADHYALARSMDPSYGPLYTQYAKVLVALGRASDAADLLRERLRSAASDEQSARFLVDLLSTHPDASVRNGVEAEDLARRLVEFGGYHDDGVMLMAWATALAEAGRFAESITIAERALSFAIVSHDDQLASAIEDRLAFFRQGKPYHFGDAP